MSMTLHKNATETVVLPLANRLSNGFIHQIFGASFSHVTRVTSTLNIGKTDTAKTREAVIVSYTDADGVVKRAFASIEFTVPVDCPVATAEQLTYMLADLSRNNQVVAMVKDRSLTESA